MLVGDNWGRGRVGWSGWELQFKLMLPAMQAYEGTPQVLGRYFLI